MIKSCDMVKQGLLFNKAKKLTVHRGLMCVVQLKVHARADRYLISTHNLLWKNQTDGGKIYLHISCFFLFNTFMCESYLQEDETDSGTNLL